MLAFGTWLEPDKARDMERAVDALRARFGHGASQTRRPSMTSAEPTSRTKIIRAAIHVAGSRP